MRKTMILLTVLALIMLSACSELPLQQVQENTDPFAKLPTVEGDSYVSCNLASDCQGYLEQNGIFEVTTECRQNVCFYETEPTAKLNPSGGGRDE